MIYDLVKGVFVAFGKNDAQDKRLTVGKSVNVVRVPGPVGVPGSRVRRRSKVHKGKRACCPHCNPVSYVSMRRLEERFAKMCAR